MLRATLLTLTALVLFALGSAGAGPATAAVFDFDCHAKVGVRQNATSDPINYPNTAAMQIQLSPEAGNTFNFQFTGPNPIIPMTGTIDAGDIMTGENTGAYNGLPSETVLNGFAKWFDPGTRMELAYVSIIQEIRSSQGNPFPNIDYGFECFREDVPAAIADADNDGVPAVSYFSAPSVVNNLSATLDPSITNLVIRNNDQSEHPVQLEDPMDFKIGMSKDAIMEGIATRRGSEVEIYYGGALNNTNSNATFMLPAELGGGQRFSAISGQERGGFGLYTGNSIGRFFLDSNISGFPFNFNASASSGAWVTEAHDEDNQSYNVDLISGELTGSGQFDAVFANLGVQAGPLGGTQPLGLGAPGGPLTFNYEVEGTFPSLAGLLALDNCPDAANPAQADLDGNGIGDACEGFVWGDADCDSEITPADALETAALASGIGEPCGSGASGPTPDSFNWGDWNCDGAENATDLIVVLARVASLPEGVLPEGCPEVGQDIPANTP